jgi:hypothetical protein
LKGPNQHKTPQEQVLSTKGIYLPQRNKVQGIRDKDRRQKTRKGEREQRRGWRRYICPGGTKKKKKKNELPLDREEKGMARRQMIVYKEKTGKSVRMRHLIFN